MSRDASPSGVRQQGMTMIDEALARLDNAAWTAAYGWLPQTWQRPDGTVATMTPQRFLGDVPCGSFTGLTLAPGETTRLETPLELPELIAGVPVRGEPLEMVLYSVYPVDVDVDGHRVF